MQGKIFENFWSENGVILLKLMVNVVLIYNKRLDGRDYIDGKSRIEPE